MTFEAPPRYSRCQSSRYSRALRRMSSSSAWFICRTGFAGTPITSVPEATTLPGGTTAPAPTWALSSITAPVRTTAPMPMRTLLPTRHACTTQRCPIVTPSPMMQGVSGVTCTTELSCTLLLRPMRMYWPSSPRTTVNGQMLTPSASSTSPMTSAEGSTQAPGWMRGACPGTERMVMRPSQVRLACGCGSHNHLLLAECRDVGVRVADLAQDILGVLAERGRGGGQHGRCQRHLHRIAERLHPAGLRVRQLLHHAARAHVGIGERLRHAVDRAGRHAGRLARGEPVSARLARGDRLDQRLQLRAMPQAQPDAGEARVAHEVTEAEQRAEAREEVVVGGADGEVAVAGAEGLVGRVEPVRGAEAARHLAGEPVLRRFPRGERQAGLEQRGVHALAAAGHAPRAHRAEDADEREEPRAEIRDRHADLHRRAALAAGGAHDAAHALRDQVIAAARGVRARLPVAGDRAVDQPRVERRQRLVVHAEARGDAGPVVLDEDVGGRHQLLQDGDALGALEVEYEAALVAVDGQEGRRDTGRGLEIHRAGRLAPGRLDLDDVGAHVGEEHRAEGARHHLRLIEDAQALQRSWPIAHGSQSTTACGLLEQGGMDSSWGPGLFAIGLVLLVGAAAFAGLYFFAVRSRRDDEAAVLQQALTAPLAREPVLAGVGVVPVVTWPWRRRPRVELTGWVRSREMREIGRA